MSPANRSTSITLEAVLARRRPAPARLELAALDAMLRYVGGEDLWPPVLAITRVLVETEPFRAHAALLEDLATARTSRWRMGTRRAPFGLDDISKLLKGFVSLLRLQRIAFASENPAGSEDEELDGLTQRHISAASTLMIADPTGQLSAGHVAAAEQEHDPGSMFAYGVEYAASLFSAYTRVVHALKPTDLESSPEPALPILRAPASNGGHPPDPADQSLAESGPCAPDPAEALVEVATLSKQAATSVRSLSELARALARLSGSPELAKSPAVWSAVWVKRADVALAEYERTGSGRALQLALACYGRATDGDQPSETDRGSRRMAGSRLAETALLAVRVGLLSPDRAAAHIARGYLAFIDATEHLFHRAFDHQAKVELMELNALAATRVLEACSFLSERGSAEDGSWARQALVTADQGRSRILREQVALSRRNAPADIPVDLTEREGKLLGDLRAVVRAAAASAPTLEQRERHAADRAQVRLELEPVWTEMARCGPEAARYVATRRDNVVASVDDGWGLATEVLRKLRPGVLLVQFHRLIDSVLVTALRQEWERPRLSVVPFSRAELRSLIQNYYDGVHQYHHGGATLPQRWLELGEQLFQPLRDDLEDRELDLVYLLPDGQLYELPLHALTIDGVPLIERKKVAYAPSMAILDTTLNRGGSTGEPLVVACPGDKDDDELWIDIVGEADEVAARLGVVTTVSPDADEFARRARAASVVHFAGHGEFFRGDRLFKGDPLASGIALAKGELFTARDWLALDLHADLVTLSACVSGMVTVAAASEPSGLPPALLFAGASSVVVTLARVQSQATRAWMQAFYAFLRGVGGGPPLDKASAFQEATLSVRASNPHPFFWAPFVLLGDARSPANLA